MPFFITILFLLSLSHSVDNHLQKYIDIALQNNPALQAAQKEYEAAGKRIDGVGTLEQPVLDIGVGPDINSVSLMQMFNWPGTRSASQSEAKAMANMQAAKQRKARDSLVAAVKIGWHDLYLLNSKIKYTKESLDLTKQMETLAKEEFTAGKGLAELLTIQAEILEMEVDIEVMQFEFSALTAVFNAMLNRPQTTEIQFADTITLQTPDFGRNTEPSMISMANAEIESLKAMKEMNKIMGYPMFGFGVQYERQMGSDMVMAMASVTLPIWRQKTNAALLENELQIEAAQKMLLDAQNNLEAERTMAKNDLRDCCDKRITLYGKQRELAESMQKIALQNFSAGTGTLSDVLQINRKLLDYRIKEIEAKVEYNKTAAKAEALF